MKGKVAALVGPKRAEIKEFDVPEPEPGALVLEITRANVCGSEVHIWHGLHPVIRNGVLGHEFVGRIHALGDGVKTDYAGQPVRVGDRVVCTYFLTCQRCPACLAGDFPLCQNAYAFWSQPPETPPHFHGAFATHYYVHPRQYFFRVPDAVPDAVAAGANCGLSQVLYGLDRAGLTAGETLVIQGAGGLGLNAAAVAKERGARVIVIEGVPDRIELAAAFGADEVVDLREAAEPQARIQRVRELTAGHGADVVLEVTGVPAAFVEALEMVRPGGRVLSIGNVNVGPEHSVPVSPGLITRKGLRVVGVVRYDPWYLYRALRFLERNHERYPYTSLTDRAYPLAEVNEAIARSERRAVARPVIVPA